MDIRNKMPFIPVTIHTCAPTRLSFGVPAPPKVPLRTNSNPAVQTTGAQTPQHNIFGMLAEQGSRSDDRGSERLSFGSLSGAYSRSSSAKNSRDTEHIPLITPEILHSLDRLEPDKGKQARLITEHLTWERLLPSTEKELQQLLEKRAPRDI